MYLYFGSTRENLHIEQRTVWLRVVSTGVVTHYYIDGFSRLSRRSARFLCDICTADRARYGQYRFEKPSIHRQFLA